MIVAIESRGAGVDFREKARQLRQSIPALSEAFWFLTSLVLFMVLGPFAAPFALYAIFSIDKEHRGWREPEAIE